MHTDLGFYIGWMRGTLEYTNSVSPSLIHLKTGEGWTPWRVLGKGKREKRRVGADTSTVAFHSLGQPGPAIGRWRGPWPTRKVHVSPDQQVPTPMPTLAVYRNSSTYSAVEWSVQEKKLKNNWRLWENCKKLLKYHAGIHSRCGVPKATLIIPTTVVHVTIWSYEVPFKCLMKMRCFYKPKSFMFYSKLVSEQLLELSLRNKSNS